MKKHFLIFTISLLFFTLAQGKVKLPAKIIWYFNKTVPLSCGDGQTAKR